MRYTKKNLQKLLEENGVTKISDRFAMENNLIDKNELLGEAKEKAEKIPVGRPRIKELKKEGEVKIIDPKYERLRMIRKKPVTVRLTNVKTGEVIEYNSLYKAIRETGHGWQYLESRDGKVDGGFKIEILNSDKFVKQATSVVRTMNKRERFKIYLLI